MKLVKQLEPLSPQNREVKRITWMRGGLEEEPLNRNGLEPEEADMMLKSRLRATVVLSAG